MLHGLRQISSNGRRQWQGHRLRVNGFISRLYTIFIPITDILTITLHGFGYLILVDDASAHRPCGQGDDPQPDTEADMGRCTSGTAPGAACHHK